MPTEKKPNATPSTKPKKVKLVRDSFCMPKDEYAALEVLKQRALGLGKAVKKSELLRAGVLALSQATDASFLSYMDTVPNLKTGRPSTKTTSEAKLDSPALPEAKPPVQRRKPAAKSAAQALNPTPATVAPPNRASSKRVSSRKTAAVKTPRPAA